jgi:hypothetical protein
MSKKRSVAYVVMGIEFYVEIEKDGDTEFYAIESDGFLKERFKPFLDALLSLQTEDDKEFQEIIRDHNSHTRF